MAGWTFGGHQQREYPHRGRSELGVECILIGWSIKRTADTQRVI